MGWSNDPLFLLILEKNERKIGKKKKDRQIDRKKGKFIFSSLESFFKKLSRYHTLFSINL